MVKKTKVSAPKMYQISRNGRELFIISAIYVFQGTYDLYWHICFDNGVEKDYHQRVFYNLFWRLCHHYSQRQIDVMICNLQ